MLGLSIHDRSGIPTLSCLSAWLLDSWCLENSKRRCSLQFACSSDLLKCSLILLYLIALFEYILTTVRIMCLYHTFHWSCCPGTALPAPYYMNSTCDLASRSKKSRVQKRRKCKIEHRVLDGADHEHRCPKCG